MTLLEKLTSLENEAKNFGFYWPEAQMIFEQITSECREVKEAFLKDGTSPHLQEELGDLIHATFCLCIFFGFDAEETLEKSLIKFENRLNKLKDLTQKAGLKNLQNQPLSKLLEVWMEAKKQA